MLRSSVEVGLFYYIFYVISIVPLYLTSNISLLMLNIGGLPPMTGFFIKLTILETMELIIAPVLLAGSAVVLAAYIRVYLRNAKMDILTVVFCSIGIFI